MKLDGIDFAIGSEHVLNAATAGNESADILTISGHMRETAGNTYMNEKIEGITITLTGYPGHRRVRQQQEYLR